MKLPLSWLSDYMNLSVDPKTYCDAMTMSGSKVEGYEEMGGEIENVVVAKVLEVKRHENSDHMFVCQVEVAPGEVVQIVTGAPNVCEGYVAAAKVGARLPGGIKIKKGKLRGELSLGMLCSHDELGLTLDEVPGASEDGIIIFPDDMNLTVGTDIKEALGIKETIVEFEITSNRPDCLCVNGLARESAATFGVDFHMPEVNVKGSGGSIHDFAKVSVEDNDLCLRYSAKVVKNVKIEPSPSWMQKRILAAGMRPINNIVDITNYVLLEYGQPMHAFDLTFLDNSEIIVRRAKDGETIKTLDEQDRVLDSSMLVIADPKRAVGVAGVMGGFNSEIKEDTKAILFESATFNGANIRKTAQKLGLRTEASARYEKGLDPNNTVPALMRACQLIEMLGAGEVVDGMIDIDNANLKERTLPFSADWINRFLGTNITEEFMKKALESLNIKVDTKSGTVTIPTNRADLEGQADIAEEVVRLYGYNKIESTLLDGETTLGGKTPKQKCKDKLLDIVTAQGYYEVMTYSFTSPKHLSAVGEDPKSAITILNPLGEENSVMRTSMMSSILEILAGNYSHRNENVKIAEVGTVYHAKALPLTELPEERPVVALGAYGNTDFYDMKGVIEVLFDSLGISNYSFDTAEPNVAYHPGKSANVFIGKENIGIFGEVHPDVLEAFEIEVPAFVAELDFNAIVKAAGGERKYKPITRFPALTRDIAVLVDDSIKVAQIEKIIKERGGKILESAELFDVYKGKQIAEGKKSVAYAVRYRDSQKTLTDEDVNKVFEKTIRALEAELGAELR